MAGQQEGRYQIQSTKETGLQEVNDSSKWLIVVFFLCCNCRHGSSAVSQLFNFVTGSFPLCTQSGICRSTISHRMRRCIPVYSITGELPNTEIEAN